MRIRLALLLAAAALAIPSTLLACSCVAPRTEREAIDRSAAVFAGRVIRLRPVHGDPGGPYLEATFRVRRWWKGGSGETVAVRTPHSSCGLPFRVGEQYRVFAAPFRGHLATGTCSAPSVAPSPPVALRAAPTREGGCAG